MMIKKFLIVTSVLLLAACSANKENLTYQKKDQQELDDLIVQLKTNRPNQSKIKAFPISDKKLAKIYRDWVGTNYQLGGSSKDGIDCSAFMQTTFADVYGISLPRSTSEQQSVGKKIQKHELKLGDLVFFRKNRHVGVYLGNNQFMHASSSEGVTISSLNEDYWLRTYTQSRRVF